MGYDIVREIKEKLDIVDVIKEYVQLQPAGRNFKALCPFHKEKTPSFIVSPERQTWRCFGQCNEGGDVISFIMKYENVDFQTALKNLADRAGVQLKNVKFAPRTESKTLEEIHRAATDFFKSQLESNKNALEYLKKRKISDDSIYTFELGFSPNEKDALLIHLTNLGYNIDDIDKSGLIFKTKSGTYMDRFRGRLIFPIYNTFGNVVAFSGRILPELDDGKVAKYINSPDTSIYHKSKILYGYNLSKKFIRDSHSVILVEGNVDMIMLWQDGVKNVVAVSGTALTIDHLNILKRVADEVIFSFDNDKAGISADERAIDMANQLDIYAKVVLLDEAKDMADFVSKNPGRAKNYIDANQMSSLEFYIDEYLSNLDDKSDVEKRKNISKMLEKIAIVKSPIEKFRWIKKVSEITKISEKAITEELELIKNPKVVKYTEQKEDNVKQNNVEENILEKFNSRAEKIVLRILKLFSIVEGQKKEIENFLIYFPKSMVDLAESVLNKNIKNDKLDDLVSYLMMEASLEDINEKEAEKEISFLLRELKKEFIKNRMEEIKEEIKDMEKRGETEKVGNLLKEFDEMTKLLNT